MLRSIQELINVSTIQLHVHAMFQLISDNDNGVEHKMDNFFVYLAFLFVPRMERGVSPNIAIQRHVVFISVFQLFGGYFKGEMGLLHYFTNFL